MSTKTGEPTQKAAKPAEKTEAPPPIRVKIQRLFDNESSRLRAVASVSIGGAFAAHGIRVMDSEKGLFVSMPSNSYQSRGETKYEDIFHPITAQARQQLNQSVLTAYDQALAEQQKEAEAPKQESGMAQSM